MVVDIDLDAWKRKHHRMSKWHPDWFVDFNKKGITTDTQIYSWTATRSLVLERDGHQCRVCGNAKSKTNIVSDKFTSRSGKEIIWYRNSLEVQHITPRKYGGKDHPSNLITLCRDCHLLTFKNDHEGIPGVTFDIEEIQQAYFNEDGNYNGETRIVKQVARPKEVD